MQGRVDLLFGYNFDFNFFLALLDAVTEVLIRDSFSSTNCGKGIYSIPLCNKITPLVHDKLDNLIGGVNKQKINQIPTT